MTSPLRILGISAYYHDSAAALLSDGELVAAAQEERFTRSKHDARFPSQAIEYCLAEGRIDLASLDYIVFYDKPFLKFERLLETYLAFAPRGIRSFVRSMPVWIKEKLYLKALLKKELAQLANCDAKQLPDLLFTEHHQAHAASAFFPAPFDDAAVLCLDGVGEWATTSAWQGRGNSLEPLWEIHFPHSLGLLYSAFTYFTGFKVNSGEYKLMGLAPYGEPEYVDLIYDHLIDVKDDGTFRLNMDYFNYATGVTMVNKKFCQLFGRVPRSPESPITQVDMNIARSIQVVTEEIVFRLATTLHKEFAVENLCLAGGVALNCVANGKLLREGPFKNIWIQPASGDAGGAVGAAYAAWYQYLDNRRQPAETDAMDQACLGPAYTNDEIILFLDEHSIKYEQLPDDQLAADIAGKIARGAIVGWFQGRMEFGPRALGNRSILGDPRDRDMQTTLNLKIKYRESFRPFAPVAIEERVGDWFQIDRPSPYMLLVAPVAESKRFAQDTDQAGLTGLDRLKFARSEIPAVTHVDYSARIQTIAPDADRPIRQLLEEFERQTGCPVLVNTSFNVRGEPIVQSPREAYACFMNTEMDYLVLGNCLIAKTGQPKLPATAAAPPVVNANRRTLIKEALIFSGGLLALFGLLFPWLGERQLPAWPWITAAVLIFASWALPGLYKYFHRLLNAVSKALGWINSRIILGAIFYVVFTPTGLVMKLFGRLNLGRKFELAVVTYRQESIKRPIEHMEKPF